MRERSILRDEHTKKSRGETSGDVLCRRRTQRGRQKVNSNAREKRTSDKGVKVEKRRQNYKEEGEIEREREAGIANVTDWQSSNRAAWPCAQSNQSIL